MDLPDYPEPFIYKYKLPSFWSEALSRVWQVYAFKKQKEKISESLTEKITDIMKTKEIKSWKELLKYLPDNALNAHPESPVQFFSALKPLGLSALTSSSYRTYYREKYNSLRCSILALAQELNTIPYIVDRKLIRRIGKNILK